MPATPSPSGAEIPAAILRILMIDDDVELCRSLQRLLRLDGFDLVFAHNALDGVRLALESSCALIILDVMLPGGDGRTVLRKVRATSEVPIIMLTARGDEADRIAGLEAGADDYLPKPFNARELVARMRSVLKRRTNHGSSPHPLVFNAGDLQIRPLSRTVLQNRQDVALTGAEFDILLLLIRSQGKVVTRDQIAEDCLGRPIAPFDRSVDNHISNLRKKLGPLHAGTERIRNLRGTGYMYAVVAPEEETVSG